MSVANGNPVFVTVGGDVSAATVTASGGDTSQTLATLAATVASNTTAATTATINAAAAVTTANEATTSVANSLAKYIPLTSINAASGVLGLDSGKGVTIPTSPATSNAYLTIGDSSTTQPYLQFQIGSASSQAAIFGWNSSSSPYLAVTAAAFHPQTSGACTLGTASNPWGTIYSTTSTISTSDVNAKVNIKLLSDPAGHGAAVGAAAPDDEAQKLLRVGRNIPVSVWTFSDGKRRHIGSLAQAVQKAFEAEGMNAADYGMWCEDAVTEIGTDENGKTVERAVLNEDGSQKMKQGLRYDAVHALCIAALRADIASK
ncbi:hypothetical protein J2D73_16805 [Acetobacter sacchari]|uniref:Peptidase S74 domain-containing protein n=1 Tax=Acetobacter sacchari TaxID=2661687 RepID=A0ABS3LZV0_9PROT|nr:hypothetical protein [Acetobacter sacchari]MBO1361447.1 hypothetical protein [Acetobacter sacchari]